ncbi:MAG: zinc ribbon domain-containing protein [Candidatus Thermoplasmatota archaeon]|jgi:Zn finger protein HypA/HybF involved in hydrogenase expression|nr:zinc ribbon domain-containing protein [Candidatus Thermoplasmatota archaeon]
MLVGLIFTISGYDYIGLVLLVIGFLTGIIGRINSRKGTQNKSQTTQMERQEEEKPLSKINEAVRREVTLIRCKNCGTSFPDTNIKCPNCGAGHN